MKIECPNCKLTGEMSDLDVPLDGRYIDCPRCKTGFHVKKPLAKGWNQHMMSACPACQYATFTDEMFDVCPKCGFKGSDAPGRKLAVSEEARHKQEMERVNRSLRPDDFVKPPTREIESEIAKAPPIIRYTAMGVLAVACLVAFYGLTGVMGYDGAALLAKINETSLEPVSGTQVFLAHGLLPTTLTVYGGIMALLAGMLLRNSTDTVRWLEYGAWLGLTIGAVYEVADYVAYIRRSSDSPTVAYYFVGLVTSVFWLVVWVALPVALVWWMRSDTFRNELDGESGGNLN
jgi:predicted Zn finger-like uncharacterized protein